MSKIRSVHTYAIPRTVYFGWICIWSYFFREPINRELEGMTVIVLIVHSWSCPVIPSLIYLVTLSNKIPKEQKNARYVPKNVPSVNCKNRCENVKKWAVSGDICYHRFYVDFGQPPIAKKRPLRTRVTSKIHRMTSKIQKNTMIWVNRKKSKIVQLSNSRRPGGASLLTRLLWRRLVRPLRPFRPRQVGIWW